MQKIFFLIGWVLCLSPLAFAENIAVIISEESPLLANKQTFELKEIEDIYTGKTKYLQGSFIKAVNQKDKEILRQFLKKTCRMDIAAYQERWIKLELETGANAPRIIETPGEIIDYVKKEKAGIGFVWENQAKGIQGIRVALLLAE